MSDTTTNGPGQRCCHLRSKAMYLPRQAEETEGFEMVDSGTYWCLKTMRSLGPDGQPVTADSCVGKRDCCEHL